MKTVEPLCAPKFMLLRGFLVWRALNHFVQTTIWSWWEQLHAQCWKVGLLTCQVRGVSSSRPSYVFWWATIWCCLLFFRVRSCCKLGNLNARKHGRCCCRETYLSCTLLQSIYGWVWISFVVFSNKYWRLCQRHSEKLPEYCDKWLWRASRLTN